MRLVKPFNWALPRSFALPLPLLPFAVGRGVRGVAVCVELLESDAFDRAGDIDREEEGEGLGTTAAQLDLASRAAIAWLCI